MPPQIFAELLSTSEGTRVLKTSTSTVAAWVVATRLPIKTSTSSLALPEQPLPFVKLYVIV